MILYNIFPTRNNGLRITKWDDDFNVEASYLVSEQGCECPAAKPCKHMSMLKMFKADKEIGKNAFYDPVDNQYYELNT